MLKPTGEFKQFDILEFRNAFPKNWCNKAIKLFERNPDLVYKPIDHYPGSEYRQGTCIDIDLYVDIPEFAQLTKRYAELVDQICTALKSEYIAISKSTILRSGFQLLKYVPGQVVFEHSDGLYDDNLEPSSAFATMMVYLNKPIDGGGTYFRRQNAVIEPEIGKCLIFPPYHTHIHGMVPTKSERYVLSTWLHLKHFKAS